LEVDAGVDAGCRPLKCECVGAQDGPHDHSAEVSTTTPMQPCQAALHRPAAPANRSRPRSARLGPGKSHRLDTCRGSSHAAGVDRPPRGHGAAGVGAQAVCLAVLRCSDGLYRHGRLEVLATVLSCSSEDNPATLRKGGTGASAGFRHGRRCRSREWEAGPRRDSEWRAVGKGEGRSREL
jgi:hypothetical protein